MSPVAFDRLFGYRHAFDHPITVGILAVIGAVLILSPLIFLVLGAVGKLDAKLKRELWTRWASWVVLVLLMAVPILLGAAATILAVAILSLLCYREYARATGLFREKFVSLLVVIGILAVHFTVLDHWYNLFVALFPLGVSVLAGLPILQDRPQGYLQRVGLAVFGFALFGCGLGHLGYMANDADYRPRIMLVLVAVSLNDVFAFVVGKTLGRRKLCPNTSPGKTRAGAMEALVLTTLFVVLVGRPVFAGTALDHTGRLIALGLIVSIAGQLGDLVLSSLKRDLGIKDMAATIPGHGGLLDRFDSLLLVAPAVFHFVGYFVGFGLDQPICILTGARERAG